MCMFISHEQANSSSSSSGFSSGDEGEAAGECGEHQQHASLHCGHHHFQRAEQLRDGASAHRGDVRSSWICSTSATGRSCLLMLLLSSSVL